MSKLTIDGFELPDYASYSSLTTWLDCGWQYVLTRAVKVPEKPAWYFIGGSTLHEVTEKLDHDWFNSQRGATK